MPLDPYIQVMAGLIPEDVHSTGIDRKAGVWHHTFYDSQMYNFIGIRRSIDVKVNSITFNDFAYPMLTCLIAI